MASPRFTLGLLVASGALGACATLLGDDFTIGQVTEGGAGSGAGTVGGGGAGAGGGGGAAGGGGSGGGVPITPFGCSWLFPEHQLVASMQGSTDFWSGRMVGARVDNDRVRVAVERSTTGAGGLVQVFTLQQDAAPLESSFPARDLYQVERTSIGSVGVLYARDDADGPILTLANVSDGDADGSSAYHRELTILGLGAFPGIDPSYGIQALFTPLPGGSGDLDFVVSYRAVDGDHVEGYGAYRGSQLAVVPITPPGAGIDSNAAEPTALMLHEGRTYAFFGEPDTALGTRQYTLDESVTGSLDPRTIPPADTFVLRAQYNPEGSNFLAFSQGPPLTLKVRKIDNLALDSFDWEGFSVVGIYESLYDLPLGPAAYGWAGDVFAFVGSDFTDPSVSRYWLFDVEGRERGLGDLPFTAPLGADETRPYGMSEGILVRRQTTFGVGEGILHVVWTESHEVPGDYFEVMYYDQLVCVPE